MPVEEKQAKVKELRESLRNGRNSTEISPAGGNPEGHDGSHDSTFRAAFQDAGGENSGTVGSSQQAIGNHQQSGSNGRSPETIPGRVRQANRRLGKSDSSPVSNPASSEPTESIEAKKRVGRMVADGPGNAAHFEREETTTQIPGQTEEQPKRRGGWPKGKPRKGKEGTTEEGFKGLSEEKTNKIKVPLIRKGNVLTATEARELSEPLIASLEDDFQALDSYLWSRQKSAGVDTNNQPVWSDLDTEEVTRLTGIMLKWGQHNETAATVVRTVVDASDYVAVGSIFIPRITRTFEIMRTTHKPRPKRGQAPNEGAHK